MHETYEENEWDEVIDDLEELMSIDEDYDEDDEDYDEDDEDDDEDSQSVVDKMTAKSMCEPVFITIGLSLDDGVVVSTAGDNEVLMITLLSALFKGDIDDKILDQLPKYKAAFPSWGDEAPLVYPDKTLWESINDEDT
jgi:hypothetical protein